MPNLEFALGDVRSRKNLVYSRQKKANPKSAHVQESNSSPSNEVTISNFLALQSETEAQITENDQDLPIALRKGTRKCAKQLLYPFVHFLSNKKILTNLQCLLSLNTTTIPTIFSEALFNEKWRRAMNVEMEALEK